MSADQQLVSVVMRDRWRRTSVSAATNVLVDEQSGSARCRPRLMRLDGAGRARIQAWPDPGPRNQFPSYPVWSARADRFAPLTLAELQAQAHMVGVGTVNNAR